MESPCVSSGLRAKVARHAWYRILRRHKHHQVPVKSIRTITRARKWSDRVGPRTPPVSKPLWMPSAEWTWDGSGYGFPLPGRRSRIPLFRDFSWNPPGPCAFTHVVVTSIISGSSRVGSRRRRILGSETREGNCFARGSRFDLGQRSEEVGNVLMRLFLKGGCPVDRTLLSSGSVFPSVLTCRSFILNTRSTRLLDTTAPSMSVLGQEVSTARPSDDR